MTNLKYTKIIYIVVITVYFKVKYPIYVPAKSNNYFVKSGLLFYPTDAQLDCPKKCQNLHNIYIKMLLHVSI